jgi:hypothetical protein
MINQFEKFQISPVPQVATRGDETAPFPSVFKQGWLGCASVRSSRSEPAQTGWLVISSKTRSAARAYKEATRSFTNHPVCADKERDLFISGAAQPPLLEIGGEWGRLAIQPVGQFCGKIKSDQFSIPNSDRIGN